MDGKILYLNTSYVKVPAYIEEVEKGKFSLFKYILCKGSRKGKRGLYSTNLQFKYILCKGSSQTVKK